MTAQQGNTIPVCPINARRHNPPSTTDPQATATSAANKNPT